MMHSSSLGTRHYSVKPKDRTFVKAYGFFAKNMGKNIGKKQVKN